MHDGAVQCESLQLVGLWLHLCVMCLFTMRLFAVCLPMPQSRHAPHPTTPRSLDPVPHISPAHLVICSSAVWTRDTRLATHATRNSRVSHRTSHTLNIQLFSHLFQIYNCFLWSHTHIGTHRLTWAFGTWLVVLGSVKYYRLECRLESFNWRKESKFLDGFQVLELGTPLVCCVY